MGLARLMSRGQAGLEAYPVTVEVNTAAGLPLFTVAGLPATVVRESRERVRAALVNTGFQFPVSRVLAHLGPADRPKTGGGFDLPMALGVLLASDQLTADTGAYEFMGELALSGHLRSVPGVLPAAIAAKRADRELILPKANAAEASLVQGATMRCAEHLGEVVQFLRGEVELPLVTAQAPRAVAGPATGLDDVVGQAPAKRALMVAAAGGHHLLMVGPPGSGKSMLAERLPGLLPLMDYEEALEAAAIRSLCNLPIVPGDFYQRPFRSPHHSASAPALVGGGNRPRPGEASLAHHGVLFLDELPEFQRAGLEALREPIETGHAAISRANGEATFPARFQLLAAMNPCLCGYLGDPDHECKCTPQQASNYRRRISGPLLDRFDIQITVSRPPAALLTGEPPDPVPTDCPRGRVAAARRRQLDRQGTTNAALEGRELDEVVLLEPASRRLLSRAIERFRLSARSYVRILRVARTIADLDGEDAVQECNVAEAINLRTNLAAGTTNV